MTYPPLADNQLSGQDIPMPSQIHPRHIPLNRTTRAVALANLIAQIGIVLTGGLVRLTGSGLGCPTWPQCVPGSYIPVVRQAEGVHALIEFGNRLLTGVIGLVALGTAILVLLLSRRCERPRRLMLLGAAPLIGVVVQAGLGGITVLTGLHPGTVAAHFLVSAMLIAASAALVFRLAEGDKPPIVLVTREVIWLSYALIGITALVLILGTIVTGSGPHSGDADTPARLSLDPRTMSWLHADAVLIWFGVLAVLLVSLRLTHAPARPRRAGFVVLGVGLAQGAIGYIQYATDLPIVLVAAHMVGASVLVVAVTRFVLSLRLRA
ncbi:MAG: COX15/CtaA family protein [Actinomycetota bacterium]